MGRELALELVPRVPSPKLIPQGDGDVGVPWDAHVCPEASRARRILSVLLKAGGSRGRVHVYLHPSAELLQFARVAARYVAMQGRGPGLALPGRLEIPSRGGAREGDGDAPALATELGGVVQRLFGRYLHGHLPGVAPGHRAPRVRRVRGSRGYGTSGAQPLFLRTVRSDVVGF